jgi:hypothetical protein
VYDAPVYAHGHLNGTKANDLEIIEDPDEPVRTRVVRLESVVVDAELLQPSTASELKNSEIHVGRSQQRVPLGAFEVGRPTVHRQDEQGIFMLLFCSETGNTNTIMSRSRSKLDHTRELNNLPC